MSIICLRCHERTGDDGICRLCATEEKVDRGVTLGVALFLTSAIVVTIVFKLWLRW